MLDIIPWHWENLNPQRETIDPPIPQNTNLTMADIGMLTEELKEVINIVKNQSKELETSKASITKLQDENKNLKSTIEDDKKKLKSMIDDLKLQETENDQKWKSLEEYLDSLKSKFDDRENDEVEEVDDQEEPGIALEDQLRITEQSAKAIDLLSNHLFSTVWQPCSKNTFGNVVLAHHFPISLILNS